MNGMLLPVEHGYPARMVVPGWYGMASVKWVKRMTLRSGEPFQGFFNGVKYVYVKRNLDSLVIEPVSELRVKSLVTTPIDGGVVKAGHTLDVSGKAWSGFGRIVSV
jgi:DMSO/TMAO reductase YedYZ molybdopterin-dependent catalytic subunit